LVADPVAPSNNYNATYSGASITQELWRRASDNSLLKEIDYTYTGSKLTTEIRKVFDSTGITVVAQVTITYTYTGSKLTSYSLVRNI